MHGPRLLSYLLRNAAGKPILSRYLHQTPEYCRCTHVPTYVLKILLPRVIVQYLHITTDCSPLVSLVLRKKVDEPLYVHCRWYNEVLCSGAGSEVLCTYGKYVPRALVADFFNFYTQDCVQYDYTFSRDQSHCKKNLGMSSIPLISPK